MANSFSKEEVVLFNELLEGFNDGLVISKAFQNYSQDGQELERAFNTVWRPQPYIAQSFTGIDQTSNFARTYNQLSVPITLSYTHSVPFTMSPTELRDPLQVQRIMKASMQRLASDINIDCSNLAALQGTVVSTRTTTPTGFDDVAALDTKLNRMGIAMNDRNAFYSSGAYNAMASNLAARQTLQGKAQNAYEKAYVGEVAGFDTYKLDYAYNLTAATATGVTITNALPLYYTPTPTTLSADGISRTNNDNRFQTISLNVTSGALKAGDALTFANVFEVHHITKQPVDSSSLKTFRIISQSSGTAGASGNYVISPPIIAGTGGTDAELQYKNVSAAPTNGAAATLLNTTTASANPFWQADAFEIMPARYDPDPNAGLAIMHDTTENGITVVLAKQGAINNLNTLYRADVWYGLSCLQPEMAGIQLFGQNAAI